MKREDSSVHMHKALSRGRDIFGSGDAKGMDLV